MNVSVCEFDSLRGRYSFVALIVKLHLESRYKAWKMVADLGTFGGFMLDFIMFIY